MEREFGKVNSEYKRWKYLSKVIAEEEIDWKKFDDLSLDGQISFLQKTFNISFKFTLSMPFHKFQVRSAFGLSDWGKTIKLYLEKKKEWIDFLGIGYDYELELWTMIQNKSWVEKYCQGEVSIEYFIKMMKQFTLNDYYPQGSFKKPKDCKNIFFGTRKAWNFE
jgi:hypothetical protein